MAVMTKVVKVPVFIPDHDKELRLLKYKALDKVMQEAQFLGNLAIRYAIALTLKGISRELDPAKGKPVALDTQIYRILAERRTYLNAATVATLGRNFALKALKAVDRDAWAGRKSLPTFRSLFLPIRNQDTRIREFEMNRLTQFVILSGMGKRWLPDALIAEINGNLHPEDEQRRLVLHSRFSWKDKNAVAIVRKVASGEYKLRDSQIRKDRSGLHVLLAYQMTLDPPSPDPQRVCGMFPGAATPLVCAVNFGPQHLHIGRVEDVWAARSKFRAERIRKQRRLGTAAMDGSWRRSEKEDRWTHLYCHTLSREAIRFCNRHGCGKIHVEDVERPEQGSDAPNGRRRILRARGKFLLMLSYKAREAGIEIVKVNPRNSERRCCQCGWMSADGTSSANDFLCGACGEKTGPVHADLNAARNIALATGDEIRYGYENEPGDSPGP
jgi:transposase